MKPGFKPHPHAAQSVLLEQDKGLHGKYSHCLLWQGSGGVNVAPQLRDMYLCYIRVPQHLGSFGADHTKVDELWLSDKPSGLAFNSDCAEQGFPCVENGDKESWMPEFSVFNLGTVMC